MQNRLDSFLKAQRFSNGRREQRDGRSIVGYDLSGDPNFHPKDLEERAMQALTGNIWVDEEFGVLQEMRLQTDRDIKIAGGLANLHKGFRLHVVQQRQPDGVWLEKLVEGNGDARALFSKHVFRFHEEDIPLPPLFCEYPGKNPSASDDKIGTRLGPLRTEDAVPRHCRIDRRTY